MSLQRYYETGHTYRWNSLVFSVVWSYTSESCPVLKENELNQGICYTGKKKQGSKFVLLFDYNKTTGVSSGVLRSLTFRMSKPENRKATFLKQCRKCKVEMNGDMLDVQGVCLRCKSKEREEQQQTPKSKRDSETYNVKEVMENEAAYSDFITSDRSGRRNAVPDLQGDASLNLQKLAGTMSEITISEGENQAEAGTTDKEPGMKPKNQDGSPTM